MLPLKKKKGLRASSLRVNRVGGLMVTPEVLSAAGTQGKGLQSLWLLTVSHEIPRVCDNLACRYCGGMGGGGVLRLFRFICLLKWRLGFGCYIVPPHCAIPHHGFLYLQGQGLLISKMRTSYEFLRVLRLL
jgi:hypothetical protein